MYEFDSVNFMDSIVSLVSLVAIGSEVPVTNKSTETSDAKATLESTETKLLT